jgi:hypothetical protein
MSNIGKLALELVVFGGMGGVIGGAIGAAAGSVALWHEKFRVKQFSDTSYVKWTLDREFAALSYSQVAKISAIYVASIWALGMLAAVLAKFAGYDEEAQANAGLAVLALSAIAGGVYFYTRKINILMIGVSLLGNICFGAPLIASFAIKYFTQKKLIG